MSSFSGVEDFITTAFINKDGTPIDNITHNPTEVLTTSDGEGWLLDALMIEHIGGEDLYGYWVQDEHDPNAASDDTAWSFQPVEMMENDRTVLQARAPPPLINNACFSSQFCPAFPSTPPPTVFIRSPPPSPAMSATTGVGVSSPCADTSSHPIGGAFTSARGCTRTWATGRFYVCFLSTSMAR